MKDLGKASKTAVVLIVGNKIDLRGHGIDYCVTTEEALKVASKLRCSYCECSALTGAGLT
jgi:GTPase SAR1 family protein